MFLTGLSRHLKAAARIRGWRDGRPRSLPEAARLARAAGEHLPVGLAAGQTEDWYIQSILDTVPVYGTRPGAVRPERVPTQARASLGAWRDLHVKREDFQRYLEWLRSVW